MNLEPAPRLPKWIFLAIDAGLLLTAFLIVTFAKNAYAPLPFVSAVLCVILAAVIGLVPFLADYAADSAEALERERARVNDQTARLHAAAESLVRASAQIKAVEEAVHKSAREAETLPYRMQEKLAEFNEALAGREESDRQALENELEELRAAHGEQLKLAAEKIAKTVAELTALEAAARKQLTAAEAALAKIQSASTDAVAKLDEKLAATVRELDAKLANFQAAVAAIKIPEITVAPAPTASAVPSSAPVSTAPSSEPAAPRAEESPAAPAPSQEILPEPPAIDAPLSHSEHVNGEKPDTTEAPAVSPRLAAEVPATTEAPATTVTPTTTEAEPPKPKKSRASRKPKAEEVLLAMSEPEPESKPTPHVETSAAPPPAAPSEEPPAGPEPTPVAASDVNERTEAPVAESSTSSDGATRLLATAYIGIGNKLYIRGDGPGLSWDKGVPMQFVSIGKWGWSTHEAVGPIRCKLYKNDEVAALTGEITLESGRHTEVTALF